MSKKTKKLASAAILTAAALIIFIIEAQFPLPVPIPGVKLGLANIITLFALFYKSKKTQINNTESLSRNKKDKKYLFSNLDVFSILLCRIASGALFTGRLIVFAYSLTGGLFGFIAQILIKRVVSEKQIWVCGAVGGIFHNVGQILAAVVITGTPAIIGYLPVLIITGIMTGILTGFIAQIVIERISKNNA